MSVDVDPDPAIDLTIGAGLIGFAITGMYAHSLFFVFGSMLSDSTQGLQIIWNHFRTSDHILLPPWQSVWRVAGAVLCE